MWLFRGIARLLESDNTAEEDIVQLAFALQVQALISDEAADWSILKFEEGLQEGAYFIPLCDIADWYFARVFK